MVKLFFILLHASYICLTIFPHNEKNFHYHPDIDPDHPERILLDLSRTQGHYDPCHQKA